MLNYCRVFFLYLLIGTPLIIAQWVSVGTPNMAQSGSITIDNNSIFVGTANNGIFRSINNGDNWDPVNNGLSMNIILAVANNSSRLFASTFSDIVTSTDNGDNWSPYYNGLGSGYSANSFFFEGNSVFASGFGVYYSSDNGANWAIYTTGLPPAPVVFSIIRKGTNLFAATSGGVFYSSDEGVNWDTSGTGLEGYVIRTIAVTGDNIIAGTDSSGAFISTNNGENWTKITNGIPLVSRTSVRALLKIGNSIFAGLGYNPNGSWGIYRSIDDGLTWTDAGQGLPGLTGVLGLAVNNTHLFAALFGGVYRRPLSEFGITDVERFTSELPSNFTLSQNYPNPFNPTTKISWQSPVGSWQVLKVFDVLGNEVATLVDEYKPAGTYEVEFSAKGGQAVGSLQLASGIYFYTLKAGNYTETKKMILLR